MSDIVYIRQKYKEITGNANADDVPIYAMQKVVNAYEKGRAEWLEELKFLRTWKADVMESLCKYDANSVEEVYKLGVRRGRQAKLTEVTEYIAMLVTAEVVSPWAFDKIKVLIQEIDDEF